MLEDENLRRFGALSVPPLHKEVHAGIGLLAGAKIQHEAVLGFTDWPGITECEIIGWKMLSFQQLNNLNFFLCLQLYGIYTSRHNITDLIVAVAESINIVGVNVKLFFIFCRKNKLHAVLLKMEKFERECNDEPLLVGSPSRNANIFFYSCISNCN